MSWRRRTDEEIWTMLRGALVRRPDVMVSASSEDGTVVATPDEVAELLLPGTEAPTPIDDVPEPYRSRLVQNWAAARDRGMSVYQADVPGDGLTSVIVFDTRARFGCLISIILRGAWDDEHGGDQLGAPSRPRFGTIRRDHVGTVVEVDDAAASLFDAPPEALVGKRSADLVHPDDQARAVDAWLGMLADPDHPARWRGRYRNGSGEWVWMEVTNHNRLNDAAFGDVLSEFVDIGEEIAALDAVRARDDLFRELTLALPVGVMQLDHTARIVFTNPQFDLIAGSPLAPLTSLDAFAELLVGDDGARLTAAAATVLADGGSCELEVGLADDDGECVRVRAVCQIGLRALPDRSGSGGGLIASVADVTESARVREELSVRATFDALTGCHNRASTLRELTAQLTRGVGTAVVYIDIDQFKPVNDVHGHAAGDRVLRAVAERLRACVRSGDVVGRLGGDEFAVLYSNVVESWLLDHLTDRLREALSLEVDIDGRTIAVRSSAGGVLAARGDDAERVLAEADAAMYAAKRRRQPALTRA